MVERPDAEDEFDEKFDKLDQGSKVVVSAYMMIMCAFETKGLDLGQQRDIVIAAITFLRQATISDGSRMIKDAYEKAPAEFGKWIEPACQMADRVALKAGERCATMAMMLEGKEKAHD